MMLVPFQTDPDAYSVVVVLEPENIARMEENDPAQVNLWKLGEPWAPMKLRDIIIVKPSPEDLAKALKMFQGGDGRAGLQFLIRGFRHRHEWGDADTPYPSMKQPH